MKRIKRSQGGFTLVEFSVSILVMTTFLGAAILVTESGSKAVDRARVETELENRLRRVLDRSADELMSTGQAVLFPDPAGDEGSEVLDFRRADGLVGNIVQWGDLTSLDFEYEEGEFDDGVDNNGNGLVDEGVLVLTRDQGTADAKRVVLCHGVSEWGLGEAPDNDDTNGNGVEDEAGFNVQRVDDLLFVRLTLEALDGEGNLVQRAMTTSVRLRN